MKFISKLDVKTLLIIVLIIIIVLMRACGDGGSNISSTPGQTVNVDGKPHVIIRHTRDTMYVKKDTVIYRKGKDIYHDVPVYVEVPKDVDTTEILKDYFASVTYKDTINLNDSLGSINITDVISKNRIQERKFTASINKTIIKDTIILKEKPRRQLYVGVNTSVVRQDLFNSVGAGLLYKDRKDKVFSLGLGVQQSPSVNLTPYIQGGIYWKIKLKE